MDCAHKLIFWDTACACSMRYESVIGTGTAEFTEDLEEKKHALSQIMEKYTGENTVTFDEKVMSRTTVFQIIVHDLVGKRRND